MDNQPSSEQNREESPTGTSPVQKSQPVNSIPAEPATAERLSEVEKQMTGFEKATLRWAKIAVLLSSLAALFVCAQWYEMHTGAGDTHALAEQAKKQAEQLSDMSAAADKIRRAAENMVVQDQRIADNAQKAMDASNRQSKEVLDATIKSAQLDERAWITVEVGEKTGNFAVAMRNTGKTPAINATQVAVFSAGKGVIVPEVDLTQNSSTPIPLPPNPSPEVLDYLRKNGFIRDHPPTGYVIAPGDSQIASDYQGKFQQIYRGPDDPRDRTYIQGRVTYDDIFGNQHETIYCFWFAAPSDFVMCNDHNKMN
jgi:cell division protein FtsL